MAQFGRTAEVLRNLCWLVAEQNRWQALAQLIQALFKIELDPPEYNEITGQLTVTYREFNQTQSMDLSNAGRGFQQILLIFSYIYVNNNTILLMMSPDAHLEICWKYNGLTDLTDLFFVRMWLNVNRNANFVNHNFLFHFHSMFKFFLKPNNNYKDCI